MNLFGNMEITKMHLNRHSTPRSINSRLAAFAAIGAATLAASFTSGLPASAAEHSLAGIRIFASVRDVLNKYGDPSQILTGSAAQGGSSTAGPGGIGGGGAPGFPGGGGGPIGAVPPLQFGGPGIPSYAQGGMGMGMGGGGAASNTSNPTPGEVLYVYNRSNNTTVDFLLSPDGRVIQITVLGYKYPVATERGVGLGTNYGKIVARYGYPEGQDNNGVSLTMTYLNHNHVSFTLKNEKVVGITVAAIE